MTNLRRSNVDDFRDWVNERHQLHLGNYHDLHARSVADTDGFWLDLWDWFDLPQPRPSTATAGETMPEVTWFPGQSVNYVDQVMRHRGLPGAAVIGCGEEGQPIELGWDEMHRQVGALAHTLRQAGVGPGDVVVGYLPDVVEAVVAFLATAGLGAIWSACGQDYAPSAAAERLGQLRPSVLVAADGYRYAGKEHDRRGAVAELQAQLNDLKTTIIVSRLALDLTPLDPEGLQEWSDAVSGTHRLVVEQVPAEHPLWVLFSSGTTGKPKGIVHGHDGVLVEHLKQMSFHLDLDVGDRYFWYTSPSWMMWNFQVAGLLVGASIVCYDGSPTFPGTDAMWRLAAALRVSVLGTSPAYIAGCERAGVSPSDELALTHLRTCGVTGSVLPAASHDWIKQHLGHHVQVASTTGGTDVVSAFAGTVPTVAERPGEISVPCLGVALEAWDNDGRAVIGQVGELVIVAPLPSMPVGFWNDPEGTLLHSAYFDTYPGVWRHGDWINGVRMGTADIYGVVETFSEILESLVLGVEDPNGGYWMPMFVVLTEGADLNDALRARVTAAIRSANSPRHVPDEILAVPSLPHTRTGKKLEVPLKRILQGARAEDVLSPGAVDDPAALDLFAALARNRQTPPTNHPTATTERSSR